MLEQVASSENVKDGNYYRTSIITDLQSQSSIVHPSCNSTKQSAERPISKKPYAGRNKAREKSHSNIDDYSNDFESDSQRDLGIQKQVS